MPDSTETHVRLGKALQAKGAAMLQKADDDPGLLRQASDIIAKGVRIEKGAGIKTENCEDAPFFKTRIEAWRYLEESGYKIGRAKFYQDVDRRIIIRMREDGTILRAEVDAYASTLKAKKKTQLDKVFERRSLLEVRKLEEEVAAKQMRREIEEGKFVLRADFEQELAGRAAIFDNGLRRLFRVEAAAWVELVQGSPEKIADLVDTLNRALDTLINDYVNTEFRVVIGD